MIDCETQRMSEPTPVLDTFVSGLGDVEDLGGGCFRFTLFATRHNGEEFAVVAKLVMPRDAVLPALILAAKTVGLAFAADRFGHRGLH